jgi:hypothetical protein
MVFIPAMGLVASLAWFVLEHADFLPLSRRALRRLGGTAVIALALVSQVSPAAFSASVTAFAQRKAEELQPLIEQMVRPPSTAATTTSTRCPATGRC